MQFEISFKWEMHLQLLGERFILLNEHFGCLPLATHHHIEVFTRPFHFYFTSVIEPLNFIKLLSAALLSHSIPPNWSPRRYWVTQLHQFILRGVIESLNCTKLLSVALLSRSIPLNWSPWRFWATQQLDVGISLSTLLIFRSLQSTFHLLSFCIAFP